MRTGKHSYIQLTNGNSYLRTPPPETVPSGSMPQRGIEEMARVAGRSLAIRSVRGDERWRDVTGSAPPKTSSMPRWGMARSAGQPGAAPAGAGLPPANFLRGPSGTKSKALATILWWSAGGQGSGKILARREDFFPERGCVRGAPAAAGWPQGTPLIPNGACELSGPLRLVLGGHSRAPWVAAPPRCVQRVLVGRSAVFTA